MRYIAVFNLFSIPVAKGFASLNEAVTYLDQLHGDPDSLPLGIYDVAVTDVVPYQPKDYSPEDQNNRLIITIAQSYVERAA